MSHDESLARTYAERKAARLAECGVTYSIESLAGALKAQSREIRRLRRALQDVKSSVGLAHSVHSDSDSRVTCMCSWCIATRALKRKIK